RRYTNLISRPARRPAARRRPRRDAQNFGGEGSFSTSLPSFDYPVGTGEHRRRAFRLWPPRGRWVCGPFVFWWSPAPPGAGGFLALEDAIDVASRESELVNNIRPIGDQAAVGDVESSVVDRRQFVMSRERDDQVAMDHGQRAPRQDQTAVRRAREGCDGALDLGCVAHVDGRCLDAERRRHGLDRGKLAGP